MSTLERWIEGRAKGLNAYELNTRGVKSDWVASWYMRPPVTRHQILRNKDDRIMDAHRKIRR